LRNGHAKIPVATIKKTAPNQMNLLFDKYYYFFNHVHELVPLNTSWGSQRAEQNFWKTGDRHNIINLSLKMKVFDCICIC